MWIVCRPSFDAATAYSFKWCQEIVDLLKRKGELLIDLAKTDAVRAKVEDALSQTPTDAGFIHYDHGNEDCLWGNDEKQVIDLTNNSLFRNRVVYNMNCLSAKILGADSNARYNTTYWGYVESFSFMTNVEGKFQESANYGFKLHLAGEPDWTNVLAATKERVTELIDELIAEGQVFAATLMRQNRDALVCYTPTSPPTPPPPSDCPIRGGFRHVFRIQSMAYSTTQHYSTVKTPNPPNVAYFL